MLRARCQAQVLVLLSTPREISRGRAVWLLAVVETVAWGLVYYTFGVLLGPMAVRAHTTEPVVAVAFSLALLASGLAAPAVGRAVDRSGPARVMTFGALLAAVSFLSLAWATNVPSLYVAWTGLGVAHACTSYEPAFAAVTQWHDDPEARRRALLVLTSMAGFASTIFVPVAAYVVSTHGLRAAVWAFAAAMGLVVAPLCRAMTHVRGVAHPVRGPSTQGRVPKRLVLLAVVFSVHAFSSTGATLFVYPSLVHAQLPATDAAALAGLVGAAQVPARLTYPFLTRVLPAPMRLTILLAVQAAALVGWGTLTGVPRVAALLAFGAANGLATLERATLVSDWLGVRTYGAHSGFIALASAFTRAAAPFAVALVVDVWSYGRAFFVLAAALAVAGGVQAMGERARRKSASV